MTFPMPFFSPVFGGAEQNFYNILSGLGLTTNLETCLDAGSSASYTSGQSWLDLTANGFDFFLGADGSATATDPTHNGTPGGLSSSEYFSFDGGDYFTYDSANEAWMENLHKDNAIFTIVFWLYLATTTAEQGLIGTVGAGTGFNIRCNSTNTIRFRVGNAGSAVVDATSTLTITDATPTMFALTLNEATGAGGGRFYKNDGTKVTETFTSTYSSPSAGAAETTMRLGVRGDIAGLLQSGARYYMFGAWEGTQLTEANLDSIYDATKGRFGL